MSATRFEEALGEYLRAEHELSQQFAFDGMDQGGPLKLKAQVKRAAVLSAHADAINEAVEKERERCGLGDGPPPGWRERAALEDCYLYARRMLAGFKRKGNADSEHALGWREIVRFCEKAGLRPTIIRTIAAAIREGK